MIPYDRKLTDAYLKTIVNYLLTEIYLVPACKESLHLYFDIWAPMVKKQQQKTKTNKQISLCFRIRGTFRGILN